jgi:DNA repair photolyase
MQNVKSGTATPLKCGNYESLAKSSLGNHRVAIATSSAQSSPTMSRFEAAEAEIKTLAREFCQNSRVAAKYRADKQKIVRFLSLVRAIANREAIAQKVKLAAPSEESDPTAERVKFSRTVEQLCQESGLCAFDVDKYLRWATKGLQILVCKIPTDKKARDREITIDLRTVMDLEYLLNADKRVGIWDLPVEVNLNDFKYKSLSAFSLNVAIGCFFGCLFCYVPSASTLSLGWRLLRFGILDADSEWGTYCLIRRWDEAHFRNSLRLALATPLSKLAPDGHRAIMMSTNTDPYQPIFHPDAAMRRKLQDYLRMVVRRCLEVLLEPEFRELNVRVQTRGLDVEKDFDLMEKFGDRLLLGMSIPTLNNSLAKIYEPKAPAPTRRLEVLARAMNRGIPCYVAMAPTFPECDESDLKATLNAFSKQPLFTIFHETINARAKNVDRILDEAKRRYMPTQAEVIRHKKTRIPYAIKQMKMVAQIATELGIAHKLHQWPDAELLAPAVIDAQPDPAAFRDHLRRCHGRISEWPGKDGPGDYDPYSPRKAA